MKKLALVTLLAVAASWLLSEPRPSADERPAIAAFDHHRAPDGHPAAPRVVVFHSDEAPRPPAPPEPPGFPEGPEAFAPPEPPSPPDVIRAAPRGKADRARARKAPSAQTPGAMPSWFPKSDAEREAKARPDDAGTRVLIGRLSASEDRARKDLRQALEREVADWVAADVPTSWKVRPRLVDAMVRGTYVQKVARSLKPTPGEPAPALALAPGAVAPSTDEIAGLDDVYTLYRAGQRVDFSPSHKARIVGAYRRDLATRRMQRLGGGLALTLGLLAVMTGYIRADEATRGYYTNRLRLAAVAGLGAAGVAAYRFLA